MSHISHINKERGPVPPHVAGYSSGSHIIDFILGITFEIWEQRQVDRILDYYGKDVVVYGLDGIVHGAQAMVDQTHATLAAYPDRLLLGDEVVIRGDCAEGYSSHRILSPMTNSGDSQFGPASGKSVQVMNIADCELKDGRIVREWLVRDNLALVRQLGVDPATAAQQVADRFSDEWLQWRNSEIDRIQTSQGGGLNRLHSGESEFAMQILGHCWTESGVDSESVYAPYCVLHRSPVELYSGVQQIEQHFSAFRKRIPDAKVSLDHICSNDAGHGVRTIAARWTLAGTHTDSAKPLFIMGVSHWRIVQDRIVSEWTVFDELAVMAQTLI